MEKIVAAAIKEGDVVCSVPQPGRHGDVMRELARIGVPIPITGQQGFVTSGGRFVSRFEAQDIARAAGQIIRKTGPLGELYSEDVW